MAPDTTLRIKKKKINNTWKTPIGSVPIELPTGVFSIPTALFKTLSADKTGLKDEKGIGQATSRKLHCDFERFKNSG